MSRIYTTNTVVMIVK